jgi:curved DNA-binding protein CbpA
MTDHYKILNLDRLATENQIKKRFRVLAKLYHPDKNNGSKDSEERFKKILNAYEILSDKTKRYHYDLEYSLLNIDSSQAIHDSNKKVYRNTSKDQKDRVIKDRKQTYYFIIVLILIFLWLITRNFNNSSTTGNSKAYKELEQLPSERPETGDIDFNDK